MEPDIVFQAKRLKEELRDLREIVNKQNIEIERYKHEVDFLERELKYARKRIEQLENDYSRENGFQERKNDVHD